MVVPNQFIGVTGLHLCPLEVFVGLAIPLDMQVVAEAKSAHYYPPSRDQATLTHALATSGLDYCNTLFIGLRLKKWKLQLVQKASRG